MHGIDPFAFLQVGAQVPSRHPYLKSAPGKTDLGVNASSGIGIGGKCHLQRELVRVAGKPFPLSSHQPKPNTY